MKRRGFIDCVLATIAALATSSGVFAQANANSATPAAGGETVNEGGSRSGYAPVNGLRMYYEIHGTGQPLMMLHGGLDTIDTVFEPVLPLLAQSRQVIAVERQGHGRTADADHPLTYEEMADDVAALIRHLDLEQADVFGFSLEGGVALQTAICHPEAVRKLIVASAPFASEGWYPEILLGTAETTSDAMIGTPWHAAYMTTAPKPENLSTLVSKVSQLLTARRHDWSREVAEINAPTSIVFEDADSIHPTHAVEMFNLLGGGKQDGGMGGLPNAELAVLPRTTHLDVMTRTELLIPTITSFLDRPMPETG